MSDINIANHTQMKDLNDIRILHESHIFYRQFGQYIDLGNISGNPYKFTQKRANSFGDLIWI